MPADSRTRGPLDRRLLRYARATRHHLIATVAFGCATALLIVVQAALLAHIVAGAFVHGRSLRELRGAVIALVLVVLARALVSWVTEVSANRSSATAKSQLRAALADHVAARGGTGGSERRAGEIAALATHGIDALDGYFSKYLPQLALAVIVPVTILAVVLSQDWLSAVIIAVTLPLIPVFMVLIGLATRAHTDKQLRTLSVLARHFLDVVAGLTTLKVFGRSRAQAENIRAVTERYRRTTTATLRLAFLSALVLELLASVSVALVAVSIGLRLLDGHVTFQTALFVLVLAPEAYLPLRLVGANYHASAEGMRAAEDVFELLESPASSRGANTCVPDPAVTGIELDDITVVYPDREYPALRRFSCIVEPDSIVALAGPSGAGKSTVLAVVCGFVLPSAGTVRAGAIDVATLDSDAWMARLAWAPQRPHLFATTLRENIMLGRPNASDAALRAAIEDAALEDAVLRLPEGLDTRVGERGAGLSAGERQRVALARAYLRETPLLLLDEPTANLDGATGAAVVAGIERRARGRAVLLVAHRPGLLGIADRVVHLSGAQVSG